MNKRILLVLTSHDQLGDTGRNTGYYVPEAAHPWKALVDTGHTIDITTVEGGWPPIDTVDKDDPVQKEFLKVCAAQLVDAPAIATVDTSVYDGIFFAGGHGPMFDLPGNAASQAAVREIYERGGVVAAVCHGPAALVDVTLSDGTYLVAGKNVSAFTNDEEAAVGLTEVVPFPLQDKLTERGAKHSGVPNWEAYTVIDCRLVTGQNPASAAGTGQAMADVLNG
ncbi:type 1 glutamine amidotransferase domain-containing protein [Streptomyces sp. NPDC059985]|uniref:type 1 glutamine amidotransferase domain-containing protein n=1 Tax=Streptomyces sp. NPDC059985 TaxID=3347025 RepID=UPI003693E318